MNIAIIGCGIIGMKRAKALGKHKLIAACDPVIERAQKICDLKGSGTAYDEWKEALELPGIELIIVSTTNDQLTAISSYALEHDKHVLVEKPAARSFKEISLLLKKASKSAKKIKVGFNLRFHPAMMKARAIVDSGVMGELMFIRGRYGHGGRLGYDQEWRANPKISGGGELIDQGVHMIDLCRWFLGDFHQVYGQTSTYFWKMPVDDNAFLSLRTKKGQIAWLQVSCTEWKNMFSLEIYGKTGKIQIDGLGGSYGTEKLTYYQMLPQMGPPEAKIWEYPGEDMSWSLEIEDFIKSIGSKKAINGNINDAAEALKIVDHIYKNKGRM